MKEPHYHIQPGDEPEKPPAEEEAREALTSLRSLAADAADRMEEILNNSEIPDNMKIAVINMVLERVYGKPEEMLRIESGERNSAEAAERLRQAARRAAAREESMGTFNAPSAKPRISEQ